jgi:hypothetical protein
MRKWPWNESQACFLLVKFEVLFRFYGPEKPLFEKTWKLPDIEEIK